MKFKATKSQIMNTGDKVICLGYCDLQSLLSVFDPMAYFKGVNIANVKGW